MCSLTVHAARYAVLYLLRENDIEPVECDWDDAGVTVVTLHEGREVDTFIRAARKFGFRVEVGRPRAAHSDPTFTRAAQNIALREQKGAA